MTWQGKYYYDRAMPMGCASSCCTFEMFSSALEWVAKKHFHIEHLVHILDDYLMAASSYHQCCVALRNFILLCNYLGVPIAPAKTVGPQTVLVFAGIELDTNTMEARLPNNKITKTKTFLSDFLQRKKVSLKETQSLIGLLNFACPVVVPGRAFLRRLIDLTKGVKFPHYRIRLTKSVGKLWCFGPWPEHWKLFNIIILEFYPIVLSVLLWGPLMRNQRILFYTDNAALVDIINKTTSRDPTIMVLVRQLVLACLKFNIFSRAQHVPGVHNTLADALSRLQVSKFKELAPAGVQALPIVIPSHLMPRSWSI